MVASKKSKGNKQNERYECKVCNARVGRYLMLDHLVTGGMAKIYRARRFDKQEVDRIVAVKVIQSQLSHDESFRKMFMSEIKTAFGLVHPNVAQTYDYGMHENQLYIAMEYVDGKNLHEFNTELKKRFFVFPIEISVYIMSQVCQGLHYAHTYVDKLVGKGANIIHRDISPHNIMISYDGAVKVIDFGIAKTEMNLEVTTTKNVIKGKLPYIAPEYLEDIELDARYDEFSLGVTFWEMLCNRRLFKAEHDLGILKKIQDCDIPKPSTINQNVPPELDEIVLKTLSKNREDRYNDLDQLNRALVKFLYSTFGDFNPTDLSRFAQKLFAQQIETDRLKLVEFGKIDLSVCLEQHLTQEAREIISGRIGFGEDNPFSDSKKQDEDQKVEDDEYEKMDLEIDSERIDKNKEENRKNKTSNTFEAQESSISKQRTTKTGDNRSQNRYKTHGKSVRTRDSSSTPPVAGVVTKLATVVCILGIGFYFFREESKELLKMIKGTMIEEVARAPSSISMRKKDEESKIENGKIIISNYKGRDVQKVFVDGQEQKPTLFGEIAFNLPGKHYLRVEEKKLEHFVSAFSLTREVPEVRVAISSKRKKMEYSYLVTTVPCVKGKLHFQLFGEPRIEPLPLKNRIALPANTDFQVHYQKEDSEVKRKIRIKIRDKDDLIDFCESIYGW